MILLEETSLTSQNVMNMDGLIIDAQTLWISNQYEKYKLTDFMFNFININFSYPYLLNFYIN